MNAHVHVWQFRGAVYVCACGERAPWIDLHHDCPTKDAT